MSGLDPDWDGLVAGENWEKFVRNYRAGTIKEIESSAMVMSLVPTEEFDVKFALEIGAAIMLNKPIIAIVMPGRELNEKMAAISDRVIYADIETEEGRQELVKVIQELKDGGA